MVLLYRKFLFFVFRCDQLFGVKQARLFSLALEIGRDTLARVVDLTARLVVVATILEDEANVLDNTRVVVVLEVVDVILDRRKVHWLFDNVKVVGNLFKNKKYIKHNKVLIIGNKVNNHLSLGDRLKECPAIIMLH